MASAALHADASTPTRFGFIITKQVGVAVVRNRTRRRLKAIAAEQLPELGTGLDVVIRVHPEGAELSYAELRDSARSAMRRAARRARDERRGLETAERGAPSGLGGADEAGPAPARIREIAEPAARAGSGA